MNTNLKANIGYGLAFGMYFSTYCIIASFNSVYLLAHNYTNTEIGILIAVGNLVSVAMQPFLANLADRSKRLSVFQISIIVSILMMLFAVFTLVLHGRSVVLFVAYLILFAVHASLQPLLNSMDQTLAVRGVSVD
ncbi:MAG: MFS transporter [Oscillospiraceae bacterium]|nr:MFS transporter [Oscillospiraceae bacterium]